MSQITAVAPGDRAAPERLAAIAAATFPLANPPDMPAEAIAAHIERNLSSEAFAQDIRRPEVRFWVALDDDEGSRGPVQGALDTGVVGYLMLVTDERVVPAEVIGVRPMEVRRIYVREDFHGRAVAAELMAVAVQVARDEGRDVLWLGTNRGNVRALRFYRKCGFEVVGARQFNVGGVVADDHLLARHIGVETAAGHVPPSVGGSRCRTR